MTVVAAMISALALSYDVWRRNKVTSVSYIQIPNHNNGGYEEFCIQGCGYSSTGKIVKFIAVNADNSVEIITSDDQKFCYEKFLKWKR